MVDQDVIAGLIAMGAPPDVIENAGQLHCNRSGDDIEVWQENWRAVMLFLAVGTQWLFSPSGKPSGINYQSVESVMSMQNVRKHRRGSLMNDIRFMEEIALSVFRDKE